MAEVSSSVKWQNGTWGTTFGDFHMVKAWRNNIWFLTGIHDFTTLLYLHILSVFVNLMFHLMSYLLYLNFLLLKLCLDELRQENS